LNLFIMPEPWQSLQGLAAVLSPSQHVLVSALQIWISWGQAGGFSRSMSPNLPPPRGCLGLPASSSVPQNPEWGQNPNAIN